MQAQRIIQGRSVGPAEVGLIGALLAQNPTWGRRRLSLELCRHWAWQNEAGQLKDMACRTLLLKLERLGHIQLPARRGGRPNERGYRQVTDFEPDQRPIEGPLKALQPLRIELLPAGDRRLAEFKFLLHRYHYLGLRTCVGENLKYQVYDRQGRLLACLLFGAAAWKAQARDRFIGWDVTSRRRHLAQLTNNARFLVLPWVRVPHLASHLLSQVARRVCADWLVKYGHPIELLETFVDRDRFRGTCYRAAGWRHVGATTGRSRNDVNTRLHVPVKDIYLLPLGEDFRRRLCA